MLQHETKRSLTPAGQPRWSRLPKRKLEFPVLAAEERLRERYDAAGIPLAQGGYQQGNFIKSLPVGLPDLSFLVRENRCYFS
jgi:hypothetical protein